MSGTLVQAIDEVDVEALPSALVREFVLDIAPLATFEDALHVSDIVVPEGMEITTDPKQTIAIVQMPRQAEAIDELDAPIEDGADGNEAAGAEGDDKKEGESNAK